MSSPKAKLATVVKTNALSPKADSGKAVEVPRWSGQLYVPKRCELGEASHRGMHVPYMSSKLQSSHSILRSLSETSRN